MDINTPYISDPQILDSLLKDLHGEMKYSIMNDFLSKYALQTDLYALKGLLAALLYIDLDDITDIEILNPIQPSDVITGKDCVLDIKLEINRTKLINIEIQSVFQDFWPERSLTYLCRMFNNLKSGEDYSSIKPCIHIGILNHNLFKKDDPRYTDELYSEYKLLNTKSHQEYSSKFSIRVLSLNHLDNATDKDKEDPNGLYYWAKLFKSRTWGDFMETASNNPRMKSFGGTLRQLTEEEKIAEAIEARKRYLCDIASFEHCISSRDEIIKEKDATIADMDATIADLEATIEDLKKQLVSQEN